MQNSRRNFLKKAAIVTAGTVAGATVMAANSTSSIGDDKNGVVVGKSNKKEILYKKTAQWDAFYKNAK
jgi:hypothetical protein